jgi:nitrate reductase / nitrite oxidoreductase, beta subunit
MWSRCAFPCAIWPIMLTAGKEEPIILALERMLAMRAYMRDKHVEGRVNTEVLERVGLTEAQVAEMYRYMAIADYEDRFVIPTNQREYSTSIYDGITERGGCGFTFGNACSPGADKTNLFGGKKVTVHRAKPIKVEPPTKA